MRYDGGRRREAEDRSKQVVYAVCDPAIPSSQTGPRVAARQCAARGGGVGLWAPTSHRVGFGA